MKIFVITTLIFISGCSTSSGPSLKGKLFKESTINVQVENVSINDKPFNKNKSYQSKSGNFEISFNGNVIHQIEVEPNSDKIKHKDRKNPELRCLILLPFCIIAKLGGGFSEPEYKQITLSCNADVNLNANPGHTYRVFIINSKEEKPALVVERTTSPTQIVAKEVMDCSELVSSTE